MEGQPEGTCKPVKSVNLPDAVNNDEKKIEHDPSVLIEEANEFANFLNDRLKNMNPVDAELFMSSFEKNVVLLPKNTNSVSNHSHQLISNVSDERGHDFVLLDSDDIVTANDIKDVPSSNGITLFGTSKKPPLFKTEQQQASTKPFAFLDENDETKKSINFHQNENICDYVSQRKGPSVFETYKKNTKEEYQKRSSTSTSFINDSKNDITAEDKSPSSDISKTEYGTVTKETKAAKMAPIATENIATTTKRKESVKSFTFSGSNQELNKENESNVCTKSKEYTSNVQKTGADDAIPPNNDSQLQNEFSSHVSCPLSLNAVQTQVANVVQQKNEWLQETSMRNPGTNRKSINILVLGQTGVGKSTWINAFANYLSYSTLEDAIAAEAPVCVIPTKFTLFDENYQRRDIILGNHSNEVFSDQGQSATQNAKTYLFQKNEFDIYIIDTPGMDDTRGAKQDDENVQMILRAIAPFKELHAICFLFKANEARLTQSFKYCISKLLGNLSKSALNNTCFVFTNARGTFYKPGDTMGPLKAYFKELQEKESLSVTINDSNTFCLDNEAFRFICAYFSRIKFRQLEIKTYADSWRHSSNEIIRLLNHAARLRPHNTSETLSINDTRNWIYQLVNPIIDVSGIVQTNLQKLEDQIRDVENTENNIEDLKKQSAVPITSLEIVRLPRPQTVCTNEKCCSYELIDGNFQQIYKTICHKDCTLPTSDTTQKHDPNLKFCYAFFWGDICRHCFCNIKEHMRIFYKQRIVTNHLETQMLQNSLASEVDASKYKRQMIRRCQKMIDGYTKEMNFVLFAMAKFSTFLIQNGISQKADIFEKYLENAIENEEKMLHSVQNYDNKKRDRMVSILKSYQDTRNGIIENKSLIPISLFEIQDIRQKLFSMPLTGSKIAEIFDIHVEVYNNEHAGNVTKCDSKSTISRCIDWTKNTVSSIFERRQK